MHGLTGIERNSQLVMNNVHLINPASGSLFTNMPKVEFKNITVDGKDGHCKCDLACAEDDSEIEDTLMCANLKEKLVTASSCKVNIVILSKLIYFSVLCNSL